MGLGRKQTRQNDATGRQTTVSGRPTVASFANALGIGLPGGTRNMSRSTTLSVDGQPRQSSVPRQSVAHTQKNGDTAHL